MSKKPVLQLTDFDAFPFTKKGPKLTAKDHRDRRELSELSKKGVFPMAQIDRIHEAIELLQEAVKDLCNGRNDEADSKVETVMVILED